MSHRFYPTHTTYSVNNAGATGPIGNVTVTNTGSGYTALPTFTSNNLSVISQSTYPALTISNNNGSALLNINTDGTVIWEGPPSKGSTALLKSLGGLIDLKSAGNRAMATSYLRGLEKCLRLAESMDYASFVNELREEIEVRQSKLTVGALLEGLDEEQD